MKSLLKGMLRQVSRVRGWRRVALVPLVLFYLVLWGGGVGQHLFAGGASASPAWAAPLFLLVAALVILLTTDSKAELLWLMGVGLFGFVIEAVGVSTGLPFGAYAYTDTLQPKLFSVPLVMACAWLLLTAYLKQVMCRIGGPMALKATVAALWMTGIDFLIDPLAAGQLGYWRWASQGAYYGIPASNFAGWFVVSLFIFAVLPHRWSKNYWASLTGLATVLFFTLIAAAHGLFPLAGVGLALCALDLVLSWRGAPGGLHKSARNG